jgi:hypothetical protein
VCRPGEKVVINLEDWAEARRLQGRTCQWTGIKAIVVACAWPQHR